MMNDMTRTTRNLTLAGAERLGALALAEAARQGATICVAVTDAAGHLLAFRRMEGAGLVSIEVAMGKARTAAWFKAPAAVFEQMINAGHPAMLSVPGAVPLAGGVPVTLHGEVVGALGISGASGETDEAIALATLTAFNEVK